MPLPPTFEARLVGKTKLTPSVQELTFERTDQKPFSFEPGQWVSLILRQPEHEIRRAYSIASAPSGGPTFQLAVTHVEGGPGSTYLHEVGEGALLDVVGPQGFFTRPLEKAGPALFVGTGTGVTPLRSMMRAAAAANHTAPMWLLFGHRTEADLLYRDEFEALARDTPNVRVELTLSRAGDTWTGRRGYVQEHVRELWTALEAMGHGPPHVYVCGLQRMVGAVRDLLRKEMSVPRQQVHSERYD